MALKHVTEWVGTAEGFFKALTLLVGAPALIWTAVVGALAPVAKLFNLSTDVPQLVALAVLVLVVTVVARSFLQFARASRLERPEAFTLRPSVPEALIGRADDLIRLTDAVRQNRLVLLDGESGCGKSALVSAGLVPTLQSNGSTLPILIRDWGDDWERGPLVAVLDSLHQALSAAEREKIEWRMLPDLSLDAERLSDQLQKRIRDITSTLGRQPILIGDQFDDYQARHQRQFHDADGNWLRPEALEQINVFWRCVSYMLRMELLHLLIVTRADTAAGSTCVRLLDSQQTATRTLGRVENDFLRPLLNAVAPDDAKPPVVSNPDRGWNELKERLEVDLRREGAILMQQVRTVLLGARALPVLSTRAYLAAGGVRGVEALYIGRAIQRAADVAVVGANGLRDARGVLSKLVVRGSLDQPPKAIRAHWKNLCANDASATAVRKIVSSLQHDEVVRPAEMGDGVEAWQLDHDYLAKAVLAEALVSDRWNERLRDGYRSYGEAAPGLIGHWKTLLPTRLQFRLCWEKLRGRQVWSGARDYERLSLIKPVLQLLAIITVSAFSFLFYDAQKVSARAEPLLAQLGSTTEDAAVLDIWRASPAVRQKIFELIVTSDANAQRASKTRWWAAHHEFDPKSTTQILTILRGQLGLPTDLDKAAELAEAYAAVANKVGDAVEIKAEATALRGQLEKATDLGRASALAQAYAGVVNKLSDAAEIKAEATALRGELEKATNPFRASPLAQAYAAVVKKLSDAAEIKAGAMALRGQLEKATDPSRASALAKAYAAVAKSLLIKADSSEVKPVVASVLLLANHPFVLDSRDLLGSLDLLSKKPFDGDWRVAVRWAQQTYGIDPSSLRPAER